MPIGCELIIEERQTDKTAVAIRRRSMIPPSTGTVATINSVVAKRSSIDDLVLMRTKLLKWSSFYTKGLIFHILSMKQTKTLQKSISFMHYLGNGIMHDKWVVS